MFATEVKTQCKTRPATSATHGQFRNMFFQDDYTILQRKIKQAKQQKKLLQNQYKTLQCGVNHIKKTIDNYRHKTCQKRLHFMKNYDAKKAKIQSHQFIQLRKTLQLQNVNDKKKQAKTMKLNNDLHKVIIRSEQQKMKHNLRLNNKTEKLLRKSKLQQTKAQFELQGRIMYEKAKEHTLNLQQKKNRISLYHSWLAQKNKKRKIQLEQQLIQSYDNILKQIGDCDEITGHQFATLENQDQFFITHNR